MGECHWCNGTGKDSDAVNAASYPDHCTNCKGTGEDPGWEDDSEEDECPICFGTGKGEGIDWNCHACGGTGKSF